MRHFQPSEYRCRCQNPNCPAPKELSVTMQMKLEQLRAILNRPTVLTSGIRCAAHTAAVGGTEGSEHGTGDAVDIAVNGSRERFQVVKAAFDVGFNRIGIGKTFVHVGTSLHHDPDVIWLYGSPPA